MCCDVVVVELGGHFFEGKVVWMIYVVYVCVEFWIVLAVVEEMVVL